VSLILLPIILPLLILVLTALAIVVAVVSWRRKLLDFELTRIARATSQDLHTRAVRRHRIHQTRMLTIYFVRTFVVVLLWYPAIFCMLTTVHSPASTAIGVPFVFIQSIVSSAMIMTKTDVNEAAVRLFRGLTCQAVLKVAPHASGGTGSGRIPSRASNRSNILSSFGFGAFMANHAPSLRALDSRGSGGGEANATVLPLTHRQGS
jgi:hypothetical protein